mmetsp:Transcript_3644/g.2716  ORF Transcript_3644/g.2716 Transcript_3644/m.2716 type:complete len:104 (-) Transcript_3644:759-1070(-)
MRSTLSVRCLIASPLSSGSTYTILLTFPSVILTILFAKLFKATSCVTITIVIFFSRLRSTRIFMTMSVFLVSKSPVGSSRSKIDGLFEIALAIVTLCCSPPDN